MGEESTTLRAAVCLGLAIPCHGRRRLSSQSMPRWLLAVAAHLSPIDDIRADAAYRIGAATELMRRTLRALADPGAMAA